MPACRTRQTACSPGLFGVVALIAGFALPLPAIADPYPARGWEGWPTATPDEAGLDATRLAEARDYAISGGGAGVVIYEGRQVYAWGDPDQLFDLKSTTKSIGITALGLAISDGLVALPDAARNHLPDIGVPPLENAETGWIDEIRLRHLATHSAGFDKPGGYVRLLFQPGSAWAYSDAGANWLADILTVAFDADLHSVLASRVFEPLGIEAEDLRWRDHNYRFEDINGIKRREFGSGIEANIDAMARIGYLYLREGVWQGGRILPAWFVRRVGRADPGLQGLEIRDSLDHPGAPDHYGLLWWNNSDGTLGDVPRDAFWAWGLQDSLIVVIPSLDLVVVRAGGGWRNGWNGHYAVLAPFLEPIAQSVPRSAQAPSDVPVESALPYPRSRYLTGIEWAPASTILTAAEGSDNWPMTWGADGDLYTAYGDGWGFAPWRPDKLSLGYARVSGPPDNFAGTTIVAETGEERGARERGKKASGMLMVNGTLYQWIRNAEDNGEGCQLAASRDKARNWRWSQWTFTDFGYCAFLNFGRNYSGARDGYVYMYASDTPSAYQAADYLALTRVPRDRILRREAYEFFAGIDADGEPTWTSTPEKRQPVFVFRDGVNRFDITYNKGIDRYLLTMRSGSFGDESVDHFSIYEATEPWGPWATVYYTQDWEGEVSPGGISDWGESQHIPAKWISKDGITFHLVFSGGDSFSVRRAKLAVATDRQ